MRALITVTYEYHIPDDEDERLDIYETLDPYECVQIDMANGGLWDLTEYAEIVNTQVEIVQ